MDTKTDTNTQVCFPEAPQPGSRFLCIHGHFYQPPRENPWLERIELQDSASPYHDWNERICEECYAANASSRIQDKDGKVVGIVNNYSKISFNFGPTLLSWMSVFKPAVYGEIIRADRQSLYNFHGHGSAMAQCYNHIIMPLANRRDKLTQVLWGLADFRSRFRREPEGMWLPETAVDLETLELLALYDIKFTVLAPNQAKKIRKIEKEPQEWQSVEGGKVDPTMPYLVKLASGRQIVVFFYDGPISRSVAFDGLLRNAEDFAKRLQSAFLDSRKRPELVHIATDGETYGHHHRWGDMAIAYITHHLTLEKQVRFTNYGEFLSLYPPTHEAEIIENTSWSCFHGIERWKANCGCASGGNPSWHQNWRKPLREAFDWLRDSLLKIYETEIQKYVRDPWMARNEYIDLILDRSPVSVSRFFAKVSPKFLSDGEKSQALKLLEMQRNLLLMYTSCGWFFDEVTGIETIQCMQYAGRAIQLAQDLFPNLANLEKEFTEKLAKVPSNIKEYLNGRVVYEQHVLSTKIDLLKVGAHYAILATFFPDKKNMEFGSYSIKEQQFNKFQAGIYTFVMGTAELYCNITCEKENIFFAVLHFGDHNVQAGVGVLTSPEQFLNLLKDGNKAFNTTDMPELMRTIDRYFSNSIFSLKSLCKDEQREIINQIVLDKTGELERIYEDLYQEHYTILRFLGDIKAPLPTSLSGIAHAVIDSRLRKAMNAELPEVNRLRPLLEEGKDYGFAFNGKDFCHNYQISLDRVVMMFLDNPHDLTILSTLDEMISEVKYLDLKVGLWNIQNNLYEVARVFYSQKIKEQDFINEAQKENNDSWVKVFESLAEKLEIKLPE